MQPRRALVVDDALVMRRLLTEVLQADRTVEVVGTAADGWEALRLAEELAPDFVTLDLEMPGLDGLATLQRLRASHPDLPVIVVAASTDAGSRAGQAAVNLGAADYIPKPSVSGNLNDTLAAFQALLGPSVRRLSAGPDKVEPRVLIADDGQVNRAVLAAMVRELTDQVAEAADGLEAVAEACRHGFDIVFMDCEMPRLDGYEATRRIRAEEAASGRRTHIVGISGDDSAEVRTRCLQAGMDELMFKPFRTKLVALMLQRAPVAERRPA